MSTSQCQCKPTAQSYIKAIFMVEILAQKSGNSELWFPQPTITRGSFRVLHYCVYTSQCTSKYQWLNYSCCGNYSFGFWYIFAFKFSTWVMHNRENYDCSRGWYLQFAVLGYCRGWHGRMVSSPCGVDDGKPEALFYLDKQNTSAALISYIRINSSTSFVSFSKYSGREQGS